jgi:hypothetical protein
MRKLMLVFVLILSLPVFVVAGPKVEIVVAEKAPALEKRAADEVAAMLKRLYQAEVSQLAVPSGSSPSIFIGSPVTNPALEFAKADWPKLTDQGHIVKSIKHRDQPALILGGGSPVATYWAACEYAHHLGVRTMLYGDLDPIAPPEFALSGFDTKLDSALPIRGWKIDYDSPTSFAAWTKGEQVAFVRQLAKLKFNRLVFRVSAAQPFIEFSAGGIQRKEGMFWNQNEYSVDGDTAGRSAFGGLKFFDNPDLAKAKGEAERIAAGKAILRAVIAEARLLGMQTAFHIEPYDLPAKFDRRRAFDDPAFAGECARATVRAYLESYPDIDAVMIGVHAYYSHTHEFFNDSTIWQRPNRSDVIVQAYSAAPFDGLRDWQKAVPRSREVALLGGSLSARGLLERKDAFARPTNIEACSLELPLTNWMADPLPQVAHPAIVDIAEQLQKHRWSGYLIKSHSGIGCLDLSAYLLSRNSFGNKLTAVEGCENLLTPICGEEVHTRVYRAFRMVEDATRKFELLEFDVHGLRPLELWKRYESAKPPPEGWKETREAYLNAMNEMYRANTRAREGSRSYTLYLARQFEFGFEYVNCMQAVQNAGVAKQKGDKETQVTELEKAIDSINSACNALAAVARSNSDRGTIAELNAYVYRPLVKELEQVESEE